MTLSMGVATCSLCAESARRERASADGACAELRRALEWQEQQRGDYRRAACSATRQRTVQPSRSQAPAPQSCLRSALSLKSAVPLSHEKSLN